MKSPFTGGKATLKSEESELMYRKEAFKFVYLFYECDDTLKRFTTTKLDEINIGQVYNQYRAKYGIPFPDEIAQIRKQYDLPAIKMSRVLGFGDNQYRLYENGDMPSETNGKILMSIKNPLIFKTFLLNSRNQFSQEEFERMMKKVNSVEPKSEDLNIKAHTYVFHDIRRDIFNGYATQSLGKLQNILLYYINRFSGVYCTMMNKLLFYTDFYSYKTRGEAMTGLCYKAIQRGPVPVRWDRVYSYFDNIEQNIVHIKDGIEGTKLESKDHFDQAMFSDEDLSVMETVFNCFHDMTATQISEISHCEDVWQQYKDSKELMRFDSAFSLKAI